VTYSPRLNGPYSPVHRLLVTLTARCEKTIMVASLTEGFRFTQVQFAVRRQVGGSKLSIALIFRASFLRYFWLLLTM